MPLSLPNPNVPTNGQPLDATPLLENIDAIVQAIQDFDGSQVHAKSILEAALADAINPRLRGLDTIFDHVASGCVWTADSAGVSLNGSMTAGTIYVNGYRTPITSIAAHPFTASKDTYIDIDYLGNITYSEVTNNAASPSLAANSIRLGIVVTGAGSIAAAASINQGQSDRVLPIASSIAYTTTDSLGNLICPRDPNRRILGYRQITSTFSTTGSADITGLNLNCIIPTSRKVRVTGFIGNVSSSVSNSGAAMTLNDVTAGANIAIDQAATNASGDNCSLHPIAVYSLTGTRNFKAVFAKGTNAATVNTNSASTNPSFIMVELV